MKAKHFLLFLLFVITTKAFAAGPVTHIFLAEKWLEAVKSFSEDEKAAFMSGNLFPDIQYLGDITRKETHQINVTLEDVLGSPTPFSTGIRLHCYVDEIREALVEEWGIYSLISEYGQGHMATLLKFIEDEILYQRIIASKVVDDLSVISDDEIATGLSMKTLQKWHNHMTNYFGFGPSGVLSLAVFLNKPIFNVPAETIKLWNEVLPVLAQKPEIIDYVDKLEWAFTQTFQTFAQANRQ